MKKIINGVETLGIIGLAKNTGKTTTLNYLIDLYPNITLGLTSIGLDGEDLDQVNFLPKPKIVVHPGMMVATAQACLDSSELEFRVIEPTGLFTALGEVQIIEVLREGTIVVAGPTTNHDLNILIHKLKHYTDKVFVDGAFNRMTFASIELMDAIVLATGASVHPVMDKTIEKTVKTVESFNLPKTEYFEFAPEYPLIVKTKNETYHFFDKKIDTIRTLVEKIDEPIIYMYIQGAITPRLIDYLVQSSTRDFELISDDPTKYLITEDHFTYLSKLNIKLSIIHPCPLLFVTMNPFSPAGLHYDSDLFLSELKKKISIPVYNVKRME
ncbi:MAG TPA: hypothetical protein DEG42_01920 [Acholeplasmataceae bacterium]|nr:MAG: hypothetical protein A2013_00730 [Tenericutes bacterium GWE2_38_8]OHE41376.1 MAG: hypothetical protein A2102_02400 [Tenericutes bacterium GWF2_38_8]HBY65142.1 hypothetical protein [Acholeplasmataceae bacterium]HCB67597.1 hypothetical protein [Acholeplasmataceae bacterium]